MGKSRIFLKKNNNLGIIVVYLVQWRKVNVLRVLDHWLQQCLLTWVGVRKWCRFCQPGTFSNVWWHFFVFTTLRQRYAGWVATVIHWAETREASRHHTIYRKGFHITENYPVQSLNSVKVQDPWIIWYLYCYSLQEILTNNIAGKGRREVLNPSPYMSCLLYSPMLTYFLESLGHEDQTSQSSRKSTLNIHLKDWCWSSNTLVTWCKELIHWKRPGKDWRQKRVTEDEMVVWHRLNGQGFEQILGDGEGQGSLACCSPWGCTVKHDWAIEPQ